MTWFEWAHTHSPQPFTVRVFRCMSVAAATLMLASAAVQAAGEPATAALQVHYDQINISQALLATIRQALTGPEQARSALDYRKAASNARAALGELQPELALGVQATALSPYTTDQTVGVVAAPTVSFTLPTGQGETVLRLGAVARSGSSQPLGAQASLTTRLPLLAGPDTRRAAAEQELAVAHASYRTQQRRLVLTTIQAYTKLQQAEEAHILATHARQLAELDAALGQEQHQKGLLSTLDLLRLRAGLNTAQDEEMRARYAEDEARRTLGNLVGEAPVPSPIADNATPVLFHVNGPEDATQPQAWITLALQRRTDVSNARQTILLAEDQLQKAQAQSRRNIAFVAGVNWPKSLTAQGADLRTDLQAGVQATFYLSQPQRDEQVVAADIALEKAKYQLVELERQVTDSIRAAIQRIDESELALSRARAQLAQDQMALSATRERFAQGLSIARDVSAQELVVAQQANRVRSLESQKIEAFVTLWHAAGLDAAELRYVEP